MCALEIPKPHHVKVSVLETINPKTPICDTMLNEDLIEKYNFIKFF